MHGSLYFSFEDPHVVRDKYIKQRPIHHPRIQVRIEAAFNHISYSSLCSKQKVEQCQNALENKTSKHTRCVYTSPTIPTSCPHPSFFALYIHFYFYLKLVKKRIFSLFTSYKTHIFEQKPDLDLYMRVLPKGVYIQDIQKYFTPLYVS